MCVYPQISEVSGYSKKIIIHIVNQGNFHRSKPTSRVSIFLANYKQRFTSAYKQFVSETPKNVVIDSFAIANAIVP